MESNSKPLLYSIEAEESVCGALLVDRTVVARIANIITPHSFQLDRHNVIYKAALDIYARDGLIDPVTMVSELRKTNKLEAAGTEDYIYYLYAQIPTGVYAEYYAGIVANHERQRALLATSARIEELAYEPDIDTATAKAIGLLMDKSRPTMRSLTPHERAEYAARRYHELEGRENPGLISFGFPTLDKAGGMSGGDCVLIGADTKKGKSTLVHQIGRHIAKNHGAVALFSLEMSESEMVDRDIARHTRQYIPVIQKGQYDEELYAQIIESLPLLEAENLHYYYPSRCTVPMIYYAAKRQQVENGLVAVIIDYVQLIRDSTRYESEAVKYANIAHDLKDMARDLDVPVIEVSQYARGTADDNHKYKGSSAWEQDASWLLHYAIETDKEGYEHTYLSIGGIRQRGAISTGKVQIEYDMLKQSFREVL